MALCENLEFPSLLPPDICDLLKRNATHRVHTVKKAGTNKISFGIQAKKKKLTVIIFLAEVKIGRRGDSENRVGCLYFCLIQQRVYNNVKRETVPCIFCYYCYNFSYYVLSEVSYFKSLQRTPVTFKVLGITQYHNNSIFLIVEK